MKRSGDSVKLTRTQPASAGFVLPARREPEYCAAALFVEEKKKQTNFSLNTY
jgi:hypothetical protein